MNPGRRRLVPVVTKSEQEKLAQVFGRQFDSRSPCGSVSEVEPIIQNRRSFDHIFTVNFWTDSLDADLSGFLYKLGRVMQCDHQNARIRGALCNLPCSVQSIHARHLEVEHDDIKQLFIKFRNCFVSVGRLIAHFPIVVRFQQLSQAAAHQRIIIDNEDASPSGRLTLSAQGLRTLMRRQVDSFEWLSGNHGQSKIFLRILKDF